MKKTVYFGLLVLVLTFGMALTACDGVSVGITATTNTPPTIYTSSLPNGAVGTPYSYMLTGSGTAITWGLENSTLPAGLTLLSNGTISGTPATEGTYNFTVKASNSGGNRTKSFTITILPAGTNIGGLPAAPTGLTAIAYSSSGIALNWDAVPGATGYKVYNGRTSEVSYLGDVDSNSAYNINLPANTTVYYRVSAFNASGEGAKSSVVSVTTLSAGDYSLNGVWSSQEYGGMQITVRNNTTGYYTRLIDLIPSYTSAVSQGFISLNDQRWRNITSTGNLRFSAEEQLVQNQNDVAMGTNWYDVYFTLSEDGQTLTMYNSENQTGTRIVWTRETASGVILPAPTGLTATISGTTLQVNWNAVAGASGYNLYYRAFSSSYSSDWESTNVSNTSYTEYDVEAYGFALQFKVAAYNASREGAMSGVVTATVSGTPIDGGLPAPTGLSATVSGTTLYVTWNAVPDAWLYTLYVSADNNFLSYETEDTFEPSYTEYDCPPGTYYFKVVAFDTMGAEGAMSNVASATITGGVSQQGPTFTSVADMTAWLKNQPTNTATDPYSVTLIVATLPALNNAAFSNKYVNLNLSGSTFTAIPNNTFGSQYGASCTMLVGVTIPNNVSSIGTYAFKGTSLTSVTIPNSVTIISNNAFQNCVSLTSVNIGSNVQSIGSYAFSGCTSLTGVTIPSNVNTIGTYAFNACTNLASVNIEIGVLSIGTYAFNDCTSLNSVNIGNTVTSIGEYAFSGCTILSSIIIPNSVNTIGNYAFRNCTGLISVTIPNSVNTIGNYAFQNCTNLNSVNIPNASIGTYAFQNCTILNSVSFGSGVATIGNYAFTGCTNLTSVTFGSADTTFNYQYSQSFPNADTLKTAYNAGGAGTYRRSGTTWTIQ